MLRYGCALASVILATGGRLLLDPWLGMQFPFQFLCFAVLFSAWYGGIGPALFAVILGATSSTYFITPPLGSFSLANPEQQMGMAFYLATGLGMALLGGVMQRARRRAEKNAQDLSRYAASVAQTHDAVLTWDWNGKITLFNKSAEELYGIPHEEALGQIRHTLLRSKHPEDTAALISALEHEGVWQGELPHATRDGRSLIVEARMVLVRQAEPAYVIETHRDITAHRRAEEDLGNAKEQLEVRVRERTAELVSINERLRSEEERFRLLIDGVQEYALFMLDTTGHIITWNSGAQRSKGYAADEIIGRHFSCLYPEQDVASGKPAQVLAQALLEGRSEDEGWRVRKDGTRFFAKVVITALRDEKGQPRGFAKLTRDISAGQKAHERFCQAVESALNPIVMVDAEGKIVLVNAQTERLFGYSRVELLGQSMEILIPERFHKNHPDYHRQFFANPHIRRMGFGRDLAARDRDGREFPVEISLNPITTDRRVEVLCSIVDITARKRAEDALRTSEAQLRLFVEQAPVSIAMFDLEMRYVVASRRWSNDYGRGHQHLGGLCLYDVDPDVPERWKEIHRRGLAGEVQQCDEDLWIRGDGIKNWLRWAVHPWVDTSGKLGGIIMFAEDITQRKRDEALLHEQQQQLAVITANVPGPLALLDGKQRYVFVNAVFERWFGKPAAEIVGHTVDEIIGPEAAARLKPHLARLPAGEVLTYENQVKNPAGEIHYGLNTVVPQRSADGTITSFVLIASDITALKRADQALREANESLERRVQERTAELQDANKELEAFSYSVSHDLRAPLRAIDGFSRIVLESFAPALPAEAQEYLRDIRANTQQMGRLVDDLLAFSRLNRQPMRRQSIATADLVSSTLRTLQPSYKGLHLELRIGDLPPCQADPGLLGQVWFNLLDNAMKYTGKRDPAIIEIGSQPGSNPVVYYVRDNGVGFDMRYSHKLFGVFQRLHRAEEYEGTGVGLAIVQRIVQRHGGRVWAEAQPNQGATFFFTLPEQQSSHHDK